MKITLQHPFVEDFMGMKFQLYKFDLTLRLYNLIIYRGNLFYSMRERKRGQNGSKWTKWTKLD